MKMAKASTADMNMALELCSALEALDMRCFPVGSEGDNDPEDFDLNDDAHCGQVLRHLHQVAQRGSIGRVIWGMYVMLDPENKLVNPDASFLEAHPDAQAAETDAQRWRKLRDTPATLVAPGPLRGWLFMRPGDAYSLDRMADALPPLVLPNVNSTAPPAA